MNDSLPPHAACAQIPFNNGFFLVSFRNIPRGILPYIDINMSDFSKLIPCRMNRIRACARRTYRTAAFHIDNCTRAVDRFLAACSVCFDIHCPIDIDAGLHAMPAVDCFHYRRLSGIIGTCPQFERSPFMGLNGNLSSACGK